LLTPNAPHASALTSDVTLKAPYVQLFGSGSWSPYQELVTWQNELATAKNFVDLEYVAHGTYLGRQSLLSGASDFAITGVPFQPGELEAAKKKASDFISMPINVATMAFLLQLPKGANKLSSLTFACDPNDPNIPDPSVCFVITPYTGPIRFPNENLAAMAFAYANDGTGTGYINSLHNYPLRSWNNPDVIAAMGVPNFNGRAAPVQIGPKPAQRSDPDEVSYYLQSWAQQFAPTLWKVLKADDPTLHWEPVSERLARYDLSRDGVTQQVEQIAQQGDNPNGSLDGSGSLAYAPPSALSEVKRGFPNEPIVYVELKNFNGDWVAPSTKAIDTEINAGGATPMYGFSHKVAGAYPFAWVDDLVAPAHGLSIAKTEGLATMIRYLATTGQNAATPLNEGQLSTSLKAQALAGADALVKSNCVGADRMIVTNSDPGPLAPPGATEMKSIGPMLHCTTFVAAPTTTTTVVPTTTPSINSTQSNTGTGTSNSVSDTGLATSSDTGNGTSSSGSAGANNSAATSSSASNSSSSPGESTHTIVVRKRNGLLTASQLPIAASTGPTSFDRLGAFVLGAMLFLLFRRPIGRMFQRLFA
jgi:hypothetical protein